MSSTALIFHALASPQPPVRLVFGAEAAEPVTVTATVAGRLSGLRGRVSLSAPAGQRLIFTQAAVSPHPPVRLVLGGSTTPSPAETVTAEITGKLSGLRGRVPVALGSVAQVQGQLSGLRGRIGLIRGHRAHIAGRLSGLRGTVGVRWDVNVDRSLAGATLHICHDAQPVHGQLSVRFEQAHPVHVPLQAAWNDAQPTAASLRTSFDQAQAIAVGVQVPFQEANHHATAPLVAGFEQAQSMYSALHSRFDDALAGGRVVRSDFEEAIRLHSSLHSAFEDASGIAGMARSSFTHGQPVGLWLHGRFDEAMRPLPGRSTAPVVPPVAPPCYVPALPMRLLFAADDYFSSLPARLVFRCPPKPISPVEPKYIIPLLSRYMSVHTLSSYLLPTMEKVVLKGVTIATDDDAYAWSLSGTGPAHLLDQLAPVGGLPPRISVTLDGISFVFAVKVSRTRSFGKWVASVQGTSTTALLTAPYLSVQTWLSDQDATAQQLATAALAFTDVELDWQIPDWLVPAGAWSYQGTPLQAVLRVAESVRAVVSSHPTAERLIVTPRYPHLPWDWATATPDVQMPIAIVTTDSLQPQPHPDYNAVRVIGGAVGGIQSDVVRRWSARDKSAPQVQDNLITDVVAARQRGTVELASSGNKLQHVLTMPLLTGGTQPGILRPGQLIGATDTDGPWRGLVRGVSVSTTLPKVRQQVTVERLA